MNIFNPQGLRIFSPYKIGNLRRGVQGRIMGPKYGIERHHRRSIRLKGYDYSRKGTYFVTICIKDKRCLFGRVVCGEMILSEIGKTAYQYWKEIPEHFPNGELDTFIVMPSHLHGMVSITNYVGAQNFEPLRQNQFQRILPKSIGSIIRAYKSAVSHWCKEKGHTYFNWQRNYYEHVVRNEDELNRIREYIVNNPLQWQFDRENPGHVKDEGYENQWGHFEEAIYGKS